MAGALCCGNLEWDAVLEGFLEEVIFELGSKEWVGWSKEKGEGKAFWIEGAICANVLWQGEPRTGQCRWSTEKESICMCRDWGLIARTRVMGWTETQIPEVSVSCLSLVVQLSPYLSH